MVRLFRWLLRIVTGLLALGILAVLVLYWFFSRSIPDYDQTLAVQGIDAEVEILRDVGLQFADPVTDVRADWRLFGLYFDVLSSPSFTALGTLHGTLKFTVPFTFHVT